MWRASAVILLPRVGQRHTARDLRPRKLRAFLFETTISWQALPAYCRSRHYSDHAVVRTRHNGGVFTERSGLVLLGILIAWVLGAGMSIAGVLGPQPPRVVETFVPTRAFMLDTGSYTVVLFDPATGDVTETRKYTLELPWTWSYTDARVEVGGQTYLQVSSGRLAGWNLPEGDGVTLTDVMSPQRPEPPEIP